MANSTIGFEVTHTLDAPVCAVWDVIGDFGTEHRWTRSLLHCARDTPGVGVGTSRTCTLPKPLMGRTTVRERLTEFERGTVLAYDLDGAAGPFSTASSRWRTRAGSGDTTVLTVEGRFTPRNGFARFLLWPIAKPMLRRITLRVLGELETFLTSGDGARGRSPSGER